MSKKSSLAQAADLIEGGESEVEGGAEAGGMDRKMSFSHIPYLKLVQHKNMEERKVCVLSMPECLKWEGFQEHFEDSEDLSM